MGNIQSYTNAARNLQLALMQIRGMRDDLGSTKAPAGLTSTTAWQNLKPHAREIHHMVREAREAVIKLDLAQVEPASSRIRLSAATKLREVLSYLDDMQEYVDELAPSNPAEAQAVRDLDEMHRDAANLVSAARDWLI